MPEYNEKLKLMFMIALFCSDRVYYRSVFVLFLLLVTSQVSFFKFHWQSITYKFAVEFYRFDSKQCVFLVVIDSWVILCFSLLNK